MNEPIDIYHDHCMFKANRLEDGKTVYGSLVFDGSAMGGPLGFMPPTYVYHIVQLGSWNGQPVNSDDLVDPDTIGIFTGRLEENGRAVYEPLADLLRRAPLPDNKALTVADMVNDLHPVWVEHLNWLTKEHSGFGTWGIPNKSSTGVLMSSRTVAHYCDYGKTWLAYRRPPEKGEWTWKNGTIF